MLVLPALRVSRFLKQASAIRLAITEDGGSSNAEIGEAIASQLERIAGQWRRRDHVLLLTGLGCITLSFAIDIAERIA